MHADMISEDNETISYYLIMVAYDHNLKSRGIIITVTRHYRYTTFVTVMMACNGNDPKVFRCFIVNNNCELID